ncbi:Cytochrome c oxidase assembly factor 7 [Phytophthora boehmeriae]|uniref:Cytochrome c oxidase assembly factor 7 n=1 Tax=Phytophthora boehmeriae TaxID=109152 RepID=A0A8T1XAC3_9STRA|nr:Cytochrome c oxidase assembly factor 7 [Phytophthora boehmeriae]
MVKASDQSAADVQRVNQQLEERHYEFRSNCNDGDGDASACHSWGEWLAVVDKNYKDAGLSKLIIPSNVAKALAAFKDACEHDDANSCNRVANMFLSPAADSPIKRNVLEAKTYLEKACDANFAPACHNLAVMYKKGDASIPKDEDKYQEYRAKTETLIAQAGGMSSIKSA